MSGAGHTPGPWSFEYICLDRRIPIRGGKTVYGRPYNVALVNRPGSARADEDKANARLIAAAPELLEALKAILPTADGYDVDGPDGRNLFRARCAIAKATGQ